MRKIKIAHVTHSVGGLEIYLRLISENINSDKFENIVIHQKDEKKKRYINNKGEKLLEYKIPIQREISVLRDLLCVYETVKILRKEKPDLIHAHSAKGGIIGRLASLFYRVPVLHTPHAYSYLSASSPMAKKVYLTIEKIFRRFNSYLLATSDSEMNRGLKEVGYKKKRVIVFKNSVLPIRKTPDTNEVFKEFNLKPNYICTVGRPSYQKNIEMMVKVIAQLKIVIPDIHLVVMGVGEYSPNKDSIMKMIDELDLKNNISLIEWIDREKIFTIIKESWLYITTSRYEGLPYSIIESLALSKACVVTECDGNVDLIEDGFNGYIVKQDDVSTMVKRINKLYYEQKLRARFESNSFMVFDEIFNLEKNIPVLESIYSRYSDIR
ncbi:glycosyltransferase family 1 [Neptunitalea chrysea]|uniref:Glycosyltransferase family 1 n=1 Tax=Neptunitalea chrysea TaxID=1647581 RepID=A0A9W6B6U6_9FLAO|nr:glycosyltransferase [Neptunitalea chrysea]GLB52892.1 glycosyltransferase family 1 [Neptunitalea chrysea]